MSSSIPAKRVLPTKEAALFKELLSQYEAHQIKKAQKTADQILKKFPEHGETLAMKGLVTFQSGKREDGLDLIRKGIKYDLTSHIVWHVFGLAKKSEKDYDEAVRSYQQALRYEKENINILRDAANLYMQLRQYDALEGVRLTMLRLRPNVRQNWVAMAVSYHLNGNLRAAKDILETYESMLKNIPDYDVEHSEILLYHIKVLELSEDYGQALELLETNAKMHRIVDPLSVMEARARLLSKVGKRDEADLRWRELLDFNPDCNEYYAGFVANQNLNLEALSSESRSSCISHLKHFSERYLWSNTAARLALLVTSGTDFRELVTKYISSALQKGVPSLFVDLKALLVNEEKSRVVREVVEEVCHKGQDAEDPTIYVWGMYFLIQHVSHMGDHAEALKLLDSLLDHTPTLPEVFALKAKILKRVGDPNAASDAMAEARALDGQDRFLNWKSAKYLLRAGKFGEAQKVLGLFTKKDAPNPSYDLEEMQCLEYLLEEGDAYRRIGNLGMALKRYRGVHKVFSDVEDDQFDFHSYALRKSSVISYLDAISWEDRLRDHPAYIRSAIAAAKVYIELYDEPHRRSGVEEEERKKAKKRAKKIATKSPDAPNAADPSSSSATQPKDDDPEGLTLVIVADPLEQAYNMLKPLETARQSKPEVLQTLFDVAMRRKKYLLAARMLHRCRVACHDDPDTHLRVIEFLHTTGHRSPPMDETLNAVLADEIRKLQPKEDLTLEAYNREYLQNHHNEASAIWAGFRAYQILGLYSESSDDVVSQMIQPQIKLNLRTAIDILTYLQRWKSPLTQRFSEYAYCQFPLCPDFHPKHTLHTAQNGNANGICHPMTETIY